MGTTKTTEAIFMMNADIPEKDIATSTIYLWLLKIKGQNLFKSWAKPKCVCVYWLWGFVIVCAHLYFSRGG